MEPKEFRCPSCSVHFKVSFPRDYEESRCIVRCPQCGHRDVVDLLTLPSPKPAGGGKVKKRSGRYRSYEKVEWDAAPHPYTVVRDDDDIKVDIKSQAGPKRFTLGALRPRSEPEIVRRMGKRGDQYPTSEDENRNRWALPLASVLLVLSCFHGLAFALGSSGYAKETDWQQDDEISNPQTLFGRVLDPEGRGVPDAVVQCRETGSVGVTNTQGWFSLDNITKTPCTIQASREDLGISTVRYDVQENLPNHINMVLGADEVPDEEPVSQAGSSSGTLTKVHTIMMIASVSSLISAVLVQLKRWGLVAMPCAVFGCLSVGYGIGSLMALAAAVLIFLELHRFR